MNNEIWKILLGSVGGIYTSYSILATPVTWVTVLICYMSIELLLTVAVDD